MHIQRFFGEVVAGIRKPISGQSSQSGVNIYACLSGVYFDDPKNLVMWGWLYYNFPGL
jgi:hypothetical protein